MTYKQPSSLARYALILMALILSAPAMHAAQAQKKQTLREWFMSLFKAPQKREEQLFTPAQKRAQQAAARSRWFGTRPAIYSASHPYLQRLDRLVSGV